MVEGLFDQSKVENLIAAITDSAVKLECNYLETAQACKACHAAAIELMGQNAQKIKEEGVSMDEMLVVQPEDALD